MYTILKAVCTANSYPFTYARKDFQNLYDDVETADPHVFLDPVVVEEVYNDYDQLIERRYSGTFMVLVSSNHDVVDYDEKYQNNIKPLLDGAVQTIRHELNVEDWIDITQWRKTEVIDVFGYGFDGVIVTFQYTEDTNRGTAPHIE